MARGLCLSALGFLLLGSPASATTFGKGSLIVPMDTTYQDSGMLKAYGLLFALLKADVPVHWVIKSKKTAGEADFTTSSKDFKSGAAITGHGYRGGPFVVEQANAAKASPLVSAWQATNATTVHVADQDFEGRTGRLLTAAPTIAVIADGNEDIAFDYLNAAGIPDRGGETWTKVSPDVLGIASIAGPTTTTHNDGSLFRPSGQPAYCQIMTMHWGVTQVVDEVVAEYRAFLGFPTHMMAECQAVNAIENNVNGHFITPNGFLIDNDVKDVGPFSYLNQDTPFVQLDGAYTLVGGSERAYSLPPGDKFFDRNVVMIKDASTAEGQRSIWMTGYLDGKCAIPSDDVGVQTCAAGVGKISYLGGHRYDTKLPISANPGTQGTRLFLNSLFEASCTTTEGQPALTLTKSGPDSTTKSQVTYTLDVSNTGPGPATDIVLSDALEKGMVYVSSTGGGSASGGTVTWKLGDLGPKTSTSVQVTVILPGYGQHSNAFSATYTVGLNSKSTTSNELYTTYGSTPTPGDGQASGDSVSHGSSSGCSCSLEARPQPLPWIPLLLLAAAATVALRRR
jgi:uncharacterized repeat protein (TIGR01451 family)